MYVCIYAPSSNYLLPLICRLQSFLQAFSAAPMEDVEEACFTALSLGIGVNGYSLSNTTTGKTEREDAREGSSNRRDDEPCLVNLGLSFTSRPEEEEEEEEDRLAIDRGVALGCRSALPGLRVSETRNSNGVTTSNSDSNNLDGCRKKLRLSKDQSTLLEESFKIHRTLTPAHKHTLADQLNLKPRQVEVWFQNRRARSKLKQIESDFERLKKKCESLSQRNQRLEKELRELRSTKDEQSASHVWLPDLSPAAFPLCSSCRKIVGGAPK